MWPNPQFTNPNPHLPKKSLMENFIFCAVYDLNLLVVVSKFRVIFSWQEKFLLRLMFFSQIVYFNFSFLLAKQTLKKLKKLFNSNYILMLIYIYNYVYIYIYIYISCYVSLFFTVINCNFGIVVFISRFV